MDTRIERSRIEADFPCPHSHGLRDAEGRDQHGIALIVRLLHWSGPSTIAWLVVTIGIVALNRVMLGWLAAHVGKKVSEVAPPFANCDAAPTIVSIKRGFWILAAAMHIRPCAIFRRLLCIVPVVTVPEAVLPLRSKAAARSNVPGAKIPRDSSRVDSAIATTFPSKLAGNGFAQKLDDRQFIEAKTHQIFEFPIIVHAPILASGG